jgi:hypothetical protein
VPDVVPPSEEMESTPLHVAAHLLALVHPRRDGGKAMVDSGPVSVETLT